MPESSFMQINESLFMAPCPSAGPRNADIFRITQATLKCSLGKMLSRRTGGVTQRVPLPGIARGDRNVNGLPNRRRRMTRRAADGGEVDIVVAKIKNTHARLYTMRPRVYSSVE